MINFTVLSIFGDEQVVSVPDGVLVYDATGQQVVDPALLDVGDYIRPSRGDVAMEITAKEVV